MTRAEDWVGGYELAWRSGDRLHITALFSDDAEYFTAPWREPVRGAAAIADWWIAEEEPPGVTFEWEVVTESPETAVVQGRTVYPGAETYANLWVIRFADDGRARAFTEWWMTIPD